VPKIVPQLAGAFLLAALFLAAVTWNHGQVMIPLADGGTLVVLADGDCHSRMQRAALVAARPGTIVRAHDFENHPAGTVPHTTAPMDYLIAALGLFIHPLEVAGAWISPLLGLLTLLFLFFWSRTIHLRPRGPMLFLFALSPALTHAFALGRPDHQSLLVALTVTALAANFAFVRTARPAWAWASASLWGFALWVSWFEPLVLLATQELARAIVLRKAADPTVWRRGLLLTASLALAAWTLEGFRNPWPDPVVREFFPRWASLLGELQGATPQAMFAWTGWLLVPAPLLLAWSYGKTRDPLALIVLLLLAVVTALTGWQARWNPWLASVFCLALPWILRPLAKPWLVWLVFVVSLWPVAAAWEARTFPSRQDMARRQEARAEAALLTQTAEFLRSQPRGGVLAPWWISPALARQSGLPMVGGTSHQSLPGTVDTARFFLSENDAAAFAQLRSRQVKYVVTDAPERVVSTSAALLGIPLPRDPLIVRLARGRKIPDFLQPVFANPYFRVYKIRDE
jgi:Uncharacterized membrane protein, required for N-linked glycosylation